MITKKRRKVIKLFFIYVGLFLIFLFLLGPIVWNISISFRAEGFSEIPYLIPKQPTIDHYAFAISKLGEFGIFHYMKNSFIVSGITTLVSMIVCTPAAYALSRFNFKGKNPIQVWILASQMLPGVLLLIPLFLVIKSLGLLNKYAGLIVLYTTFALPFCTWMLRGYFDAIPSDMEECAMVDGATRLQALWHIVIPVALPGMIAAAVFAFLTGYGEYLYSLTIVTNQRMKTATVQIATLSSSQYGTLWGPITAGAIILMVPVVVLFSFFQKFLVAGLTGGALKE